jgi:ectoine hydroxylase-related dioxygenase (phytanoyl-CoA dioxygenase family)
MVPTTAPTDDSSSSEEDELFPSLAGFGDAGSEHETDSDTDGTLIDAGGGVGDGGGLVVRSVNGDSGNSEGEEKGQTTSSEDEDKQLAATRTNLSLEEVEQWFLSAPISIAPATRARWAAFGPSSMAQDGALYVPGAVSDPALLAAACVEIDACLATAIAAVEAEDATGAEEVRWLGAIRNRVDRWDLRVSFRQPAIRAVLIALVKRLRPVLEDLLTEDGQVCELSCIVADPGATRQPLHPDTVIGDGTGIITVFMPLQAVDTTMGPTVTLPGTHTAAGHAAFAAMGQGMLDDTDAHPPWAFVGAAGDALVMDSQLLHCGGGNTSPRRRRLLYASFHVPFNRPKGSTFSLLAEYTRKLKLKHVGRWGEIAALAELEVEEGIVL